MRTDIDVPTPGGLRVTGIATGPGIQDTPLLVCLPGGSYTARYFDVPGFSLLDVAEANGFTAIALDRPGYGGSDLLPADERTFARSAEVLDEAIAALWADYGAGHPGVVIISHSIGSAVTVHIAARHDPWQPQRFETLLRIGEDVRIGVRSAGVIHADGSVVASAIAGVARAQLNLAHGHAHVRPLAGDVHLAGCGFVGGSRLRGLLDHDGH